MIFRFGSPDKITTALMRSAKEPERTFSPISPVSFRLEYSNTGISLRSPWMRPGTRKYLANLGNDLQLNVCNFVLHFLAYLRPILSDNFQTLIETLAQSSGKAEATGCFSTYLHSTEIEHFAYLGFQHGPSDNRAPFRAGSYPAAWIEEYMSAALYAVDPVVLKAATSNVPLSWSADLPEPIDPHGRSPELFERAAAHGIRSGFTIPIRSSIGQLATMTFASPRSWKEYEAEVARLQPQLHLGAFHYHTAIERIIRPEGLVDLSPREKLCLTLASQGMSAKEISRALGVSPRTVRFHEDNARSKLGASNIGQAIAAASSLGLL